jgi:glycolate oxidase FAD binding subunit
MSRPAHASFTRLEEIVGSAQVATDTAGIAVREVCGLRPAVIIRPADAVQVAEILYFAAAEKLAVIPTGSGTKLGIGSPPARYDIALDLSRMNRVLAYDPQDLTLGAEPGVRIWDLLRTLAEKKQFLPLAVPFSDRATIGGIVAANSSSPLRHAYGSVRDFCLGMEFVTGEGAQAKSGGRVVKNVTGYDLHKLLIGSLGTLAVITRVNFRTFPMPQAQESFVTSFSTVESAFEFCQAVSHSVLSPQMVEVANPGAGRFLFSGDAAPRIMPMQWSVVITAAGQPPVVERYARELGHLAVAARAVEFLPINDPQHQFVFSRIQEFPRLVLEAAPDTAIFRIGVMPTRMPSLLKDLSKIAKQYGTGLATLTRASGIVYAAFFSEAGSEAPSAITVTAVNEVFRTCSLPQNGAQAMLEWCPTEMKTSSEVVWGASRPDFELMRRVKNSFDPVNVLAPGRFAGGI